MADTISIGVAFTAGLVSFLSPCVLPIIPGFLAYLAGVSLKESEGGQKRLIFINSAFFVLGFSAIFSILGVLLNAFLSGVAGDTQTWLSRIGGVVVIFFGLYLTKLIKLPFLEREYKFGVRFKIKSRYLTSFIFGAAFAAGWTPCVGAVLGGILGLAASQPGSALYLLFSYSIGLGIPFLIVGLCATHAGAFIARHERILSGISIAFGVLLVALGILVFTEKLSVIGNFEILNTFLLK